MLVAVMAVMTATSLSASAQTRNPQQTSVHGLGFGGGPRSEASVTVDFINNRTVIVSCSGVSEVTLFLTNAKCEVVETYVVYEDIDETIKFTQANGNYKLIAMTSDGYYKEWPLCLTGLVNKSSVITWSRTSR